MSEQAALVTGASRGIGRAVALALAAEGRPIAINYRSGADEAKETLAMVEEIGGRGICVQADVTDSEQIDRCFSEVEKELGAVTVLVNNAGVRADGLALSMTDEMWDRVIRTNLFGTFACSRRALRGMLRTRWGRIVNVSSIAGIQGSPGQANYSAAKAGVVGFTRTLAREVAAKNITVNAVAPGLVTTELTETLGEKRLAEITSHVPQGRPGTPEEVAGAVRWLCGEEAGYMTGSVLTLDGGMSA